jgi:hypothetical protein
MMWSQIEAQRETTGFATVDARAPHFYPDLVIQVIIRSGVRWLS